MRDIWTRLREEFQDEEARREYVDEFVDTMISLQIRVLRQERNWSQKRLGEKGEMGQQQVSLLESADYSSWTITTLKRLAAAFDLRLRVSFESFGTLRDDLQSLRRRDLQRASFANDPAFQGECATTPRAMTDTVLPFRQPAGSSVVPLRSQRAGSAVASHG